MPPASGGNVLHQIQIQLVGDLRLFVQNLQSAQIQTQTTTKAIQSGFQRAAGSVSQLSEKLRLVPAFVSQIAGAGMAAFGGMEVSRFITDIVKLAAKVEVLEVVSKQVGKVAGHTATEIDQLVQSIKKMNITTQMANMTTALMIQANLDLSKATQLARVAQDAGVLANVSSQEALRGLVHGIVTLQPEVLRTYKIITNLELAYRRYAASIGISFDELDQTVKQQIAMNEVLKVGARIHGTYLAAMTKAGKQMLSLERVTEEFRLSMGREFQSGFSRFIVTLTEFFNTAKESKKLHDAFALIANVLDNLFQKLLWFGNFAVRNPNLLLTIFNVAIITGITRSIGGLVGSLAGMMKLLFYGQFIDKIGTIIFLASTLGYALSKLGPVVSALMIPLSSFVAVLGVFGFNIKLAVQAIVTFKFALVAFATTLPGMIGIIGVLAGVIGLIVPLFGGVSKNAQEAKDGLAKLRLEANESANEYRDLTAQGLELMNQYVSMYETVEENDQKTKDLNDTLEDLRVMFPKYLQGVTDLAEAYRIMKDEAGGAAGAIRKVAMESAELTIRSLVVKNVELQEQLPKNIEASKKSLLEFKKWLRENLYKKVGGEFEEQRIQLLPTEAYELFGDRVEHITLALAELQSRASKGQNISSELAEQRGEWDKLNKEMGLWNALNVGSKSRTAGLIAELQMHTETIVQNTEAFSNQYDEIGKNLAAISELEQVVKTGLSPSPPVIIPTVQKEDVQKLKRLIIDLGKKTNQWLVSGMEETEESVRTKIRAETENNLLDLQTAEESLTSIMNKPQYAKYKDQIKDFAVVQNALLIARKAALGAGQRAEVEALDKLSSDMRSRQEGILKDQVKAGDLTLWALRDFYTKQIALISSLGAQATNKQVEQLNSYKASVAEIDTDDLKQKESYYRAMLKYDEAYYEKLRDILRKQLPLVEKKYTKQSSQYIEAEEEIDRIEQMRIQKHTDRYEQMAKADGSYYRGYVAYLDQLLTSTEAYFYLGDEGMQEVVAKRMAAEEAYLKWRLEQWKENNWHIGSLLNTLEDGYRSMVQSFTNMEMTGKQRREQIWESMRSSFIQAIGEMIQKWVMFQLLTGLFPNMMGGVSLGRFATGGTLFNIGRQGGGYAGDSPENQAAGVYHGKEYITNARATKIYRPLLELMNAGSDIGRVLHLILQGGGVEGYGVAPNTGNISRMLNRLVDKLNPSNLPIELTLQPVPIVNDRGIALATANGEHRTKRLGIS